MIRNQKVCLSVRFGADLPSLTPTEIRGVVPFLHDDVADSIRAISEQVQPSIAGPAVARLERLGDCETKLSEWERQGIHVLLESEDEIPAQLVTSLKSQAPVALYQLGVPISPERKWLGVVGSRAANEALLEIAAEVAQMASDQGYGVVSGGAKGIDQAATRAVFRSAPTVSILATGLEVALREFSRLDEEAQQQTTILSAVHPQAGFSVGQAMARNKLIYGFAELTVVVCCEVGTGGTWAGATEALSKGYGSVGVWMGRGAPEANQALVDKGAIPIESIPFDVADVGRADGAQGLFDL